MQRKKNDNEDERDTYFFKLMNQSKNLVPKHLENGFVMNFFFRSLCGVQTFIVAVQEQKRRKNASKRLYCMLIDHQIVKILLFFFCSCQSKL